MTLNEYLTSERDVNDPKVYDDNLFPLARRIECQDGFSLSVQATHGAYCQPRRNVGPWYQVEVGYPSETPTPIMAYCEDPERPTDTVYGYVPIEMVEELIASHGGFKRAIDWKEKMANPVATPATPESDDTQAREYAEADQPGEGK